MDKPWGRWRLCMISTDAALQLDLPRGKFPRQAQFSVTYPRCRVGWAQAWQYCRYATWGSAYSQLTFAVGWGEKGEGGETGKKALEQKLQELTRKDPPPSSVSQICCLTHKTSHNPLIVFPAELSCLPCLPLIISSALTCILQYSYFVSC